MSPNNRLGPSSPSCAHPSRRWVACPSLPVAESHAFYVQLFSPARPSVSARPGTSSLSPTGPLLEPAFSACLSPNHHPRLPITITRRWHGWRREHALTLTPSVQSFLNLRQTVTPSRANQALIGFGDFVPPQKSRRRPGLTGSARIVPERCYSHAPTSPRCPAPRRKSVASRPRLVRPTTPCFSVQHSRKTRSNRPISRTIESFTSPHTDCCRININCNACHSRHWQRQSLRRNKPRGDGLLMTEEVVEELSLDADLVVLSACDTGGPGNETGGEALSGLARAFFYAGCSLAPGQPLGGARQTDHETADRHFQAAYQPGMSPWQRPCGKAKWTLIEKPSLSHPLAWAGFTVVGDGALRLSPGVSSPTRTADAGA